MASDPTHQPDTGHPPRFKHRRTLLTREIFWRDHQKWLEGQGYMLRPRYHPNWVPSWGPDESYEKSEDGQWSLVGGLFFSFRNPRH